MMTVRAASAVLSAGIVFAVNPLALKAQEPKRFEHGIVEVLPDTTNMQTHSTSSG
jgi:hypothetical protein